jgi:hypothetical protein
LFFDDFQPFLNFLFIDTGAIAPKQKFDNIGGHRVLQNRTGSSKGVVFFNEGRRDFDPFRRALSKKTVHSPLSGLKDP